jgi:putative FmdB family regulatory protein
MPIYEYQCQSCGMKRDFLRKVSDPPLTTCPECGKETLQKMLTAAGFQLKGTGWYATDFKGGGKPAATTSVASGESKTSSEPDAKAGTGGETKTETKTESAAPAASGSPSACH